MVDRVRPFLRFDEAILGEITSEYVKSMKTLMSRKNPTDLPIVGWGLGPSIDLAAGAILSAAPTIRTPAEYYAAGTTHESIHPSVHYAMENLDYRPEALRNWTRVANKDIKLEKNASGNEILRQRDPKGFTYIKNVTNVQEGTLQNFFRYLNGRPVPTQDLKARLEIPEFIIPQALSGVSGAWNGNGDFSMERRLIHAAKSDVLNTISMEKNRHRDAVKFLAKLDQENFSKAA